MGSLAVVGLRSRHERPLLAAAEHRGQGAECQAEGKPAECMFFHEASMTESDYLERIEAAFQWVEDRADRWSEQAALDLECHRTARVMELEFESGEVIVVNAQAPTQQLWLASRLGALHFVWNQEAGCWTDTRGAGEFEQVFCAHASMLAGTALSPKA